MAREYDRIIKENLKEVVDTFISKVLGIEIKKTILLETKLQVTDERDADFILRVEPINGLPFILHIEFQSTNDSNMLYRMLRYLVYIHYEQDKSQRLPVKQYVIYIGKEKLSMNNQLNLQNINYSYELIDIREIACDKFLTSDKPEEIILSVLCDFKGKDETDIVIKIIKRLKEKASGQLSLSKYIRQLEIISKLRDLQEIVIEEEHKMALVYDMETDIRFLQGEERGFIKGEEKGFIKGEEKGKIEGKLEGELEGEKKGKIKGKLEGKIEGLKEAIELGLDVKFGTAGLALMDRVRDINDIEILGKVKELVRKSNDLIAIKNCFL